MLKEFMGKLKCMKRSIVKHKYTLNFEIMRLGLIRCK